MVYFVQTRLVYVSLLSGRSVSDTVGVILMQGGCFPPRGNLTGGMERGPGTIRICLLDNLCTKISLTKWHHIVINPYIER